MIAQVLIPSSQLVVWELPSKSVGWMYGVEAIGNVEGSAFAGLIWANDKLPPNDPLCHTIEIESQSFQQTSSLLKSLGSRLGHLAELALLKLAVRLGTGINRSWKSDFYVSTLSCQANIPIAKKICVKKSFSTYEQGEQRDRNIALDAHLGFGSWGDLISFTTENPNFLWIEDPLPIEEWKRLPICPTPIAYGEHAANFDEVREIASFDNGANLWLNIELSRLGPLEFEKSLVFARKLNIPVIFHGHLPFETALLLNLLEIEGTIEFNLCHYRERVPFSFSLSELPFDKGLDGTNRWWWDKCLQASPPKKANRR